QRRRMRPALDAAPACLDTYQPHCGVCREGMEHTDGVAATANTRHHDIGQLPDLVEHLLARLVPNHRLEVADDAWVGMGSHRRADEIVSHRDISHPVTQRLIDGILERATARAD